MEIVYLFVGKGIIWSVAWLLLGWVMLRLTGVVLDSIEKTPHDDSEPLEWFDAFGTFVERTWIGTTIRWIEAHGDVIPTLMWLAIGPIVGTPLIALSMFEAYCVHPIRRRIRARMMGKTPPTPAA
ncbi:MAG: hypothetical protein Q7T01_03055 [bacterium]|nr:hypothetical protein [bacterium]